MRWTGRCFTGDEPGPDTDQLRPRPRPAPEGRQLLRRVRPADEHRDQAGAAGSAHRAPFLRGHRADGARLRGQPDPALALGMVPDETLQRDDVLVMLGAAP